MIKRLLLLFLLFVSFTYAQEVKIAVAANASYVIEEIVKEFKKNYPESKITITLGSSGKLSAQILHGAPFDIFMSADMNYPEYLYNQKIALNEPKVYAQGALAILTLKDFDLSNGIFVLNEKNISKIAIANPKTAPYGKATLQALKKSNIYDGIKNKFVYGESISQTLSYLITAADIGIVAKSSLYSSHMIKYRNWIEVNTDLYTPIKQGMVLLKSGRNNNLANKFYNFVLSDKSKKILKRFGYII